MTVAPYRLLKQFHRHVGHGLALCDVEDFRRVFFKHRPSYCRPVIKRALYLGFVRPRRAGSDSPLVECAVCFLNHAPIVRQRRRILRNVAERKRVSAMRITAFSRCSWERLRSFLTLAKCYGTMPD